jgi:mannitol-1-phosphate 5-dehydrogenase
MAEHTFAGFGFGPIQAGLFAKEAFQSGNFSRIVVAEIDQRLVDAVRSNHGTYYVNVAARDRIETVRIDGVELLNPTIPQEGAVLREVLARATEITTCLPSVNFFDSGGPASVAALIADGMRQRQADATIIYAAENHNHAAELLEEAVVRKLSAGRASPLVADNRARPTRSGASRQGDLRRVQFLNTVIGKMSQVVTDPREIAERGLAPIAPGIERAFLVEEFNRILVTRTTIPGFVPGIRVFIEKEDLLPFEEAKLYGHNAIHALLGFLAMVKGYGKMTALRDDAALMRVAREAFVQESGGALVRKYAARGDELFTEAGYRRYAEDLLERMTNPYLADTAARAARDVVRKLGANDRIFGTMSLALEYGIEPKNMALGAMAGIILLLANAAENHLPAEFHSLRWQALDAESLTRLLSWLWQNQPLPFGREIIASTYRARQAMAGLLTL